MSSLSLQIASPAMVSACLFASVGQWVSLLSFIPQIERPPYLMLFPLFPPPPALLASLLCKHSSVFVAIALETLLYVVTHQEEFTSSWDSFPAPSQRLVANSGPYWEDIKTITQHDIFRVWEGTISPSCPMILLNRKRVIQIILDLISR